MPDRLIKGPDGVTHKFPADATDDEISAALSAPPPYARGEAKKRSWADVAVDALPAAGGLAGGIIGGIGGTVAGFGVGGVPGAVGGAALGGGFGESAKQLINRARGAEAPNTPGEAATGIAKQAAIQGGSELAGAGVMKGAKMAAHGLMDFAIRPAPTVAEEFGDIAATALRERIPVGSVIPGARKGSNIAQAALRGSASTTRGLLDTAAQAGTTFSPASIASTPFARLVDDIARQPLSESEINHVTQMFQEYMLTKGGPGGMSPAALKDMKQAAQRVAKPIFKALNAGNIPPAGDALKAQFNKVVADGAKEALETISGVGASEARTQSLIGATKAIKRAEVRRLPLIAETAAPLAGAVAGGMAGDGARGRSENAASGVGVALLTRAMLSPRSTSRTALTLTAPAIQQALRQMPRAAVYALLNDLQKGQHEQPDGQ